MLGVGVDAVDYEGAVARIVAAARERRPLAVSALAVHGVMTGALDRAHRYRLNRLDLVCPDGQPVRWALRLLHGARLPDRVYGPRLMLEVCRAAADAGLPVFLFGGDEELLATLEEQLRSRFPNLRMAGKRPSMFRQLTPEEFDDLGAKCATAALRSCLWAWAVRGRKCLPTSFASWRRCRRLPWAPRSTFTRGGCRRLRPSCSGLGSSGFTAWRASREDSGGDICF